MTACCRSSTSSFRCAKNVIFERARFTSRYQNPRETAEHYITALYTLSEDCDYRALREELIRDRLVVGIRDVKLSERLQMDPNLTLQKAKKMVRQVGAVQEQQLILKGESSSDPIQVDHLRGKPRARTSPVFKPQSRKRPSPKLTTSPKQCSRCGKGSHKKDECPARDAVCHKCLRKGHYAALCFSKTKAPEQLQNRQLDSTYSMSNDSTDDVQYLETAYLDTISGNDHMSWTAQVLVGARQVTFKLDTGAEVTAISDKVHQTLEDATLTKPTKVLYGPGHTSLPVLG